MEKAKLNEIIANHQHYLKQDCEGWEHMRADLSGEDLSVAYLYKVNLSGANLEGANLSRAIMEYAVLENANLYHANLNDANLHGATLNDASLNYAELKDAKIDYATLKRASLNFAVLENADMENTKMQDASLIGANLKSAKLVSAELENADMTNASLEEANLHHSIAKNAKFENAVLTKARMSLMDLTGANFKNAYMRETNISHTTAEKAILINAYAMSADFEASNLSEANLQNANLYKAQVERTKVKNTISGPRNISNAVKSARENMSPTKATPPQNNTIIDATKLKEIIDNHQHWLNHDCDGWEYMRANLSCLNLSGMDLSGADLRNATIYHTDLEGANLSGANLEHADIIETNLNGANLYQVNLSDAMAENVNLKNANLENANLEEATMNKTNLECANLTGANLYNAILDHAKMKGVTLHEANMNSAKMENADLRYADMSDANMNSCQLMHANMAMANMNDTNLSSANLACANLHMASLRSAHLYKACLSEADLSKTNLKDADMESACLNYANLSYSCLENANLIVAELHGADLKQANLRSAKLRSAKLVDTNMRYADLSNTDMRSVDLEYANLIGANLSYADMQDCEMYETDLRGAKLYKVEINETEILYHAELDDYTIAHMEQPFTDIDYNKTNAINQIITGETGCGKTYSAVNDEIDAGRSFIYMGPCRQLLYETYRKYADPREDGLSTGEVKYNTKNCRNLYAVYESVNEKMLDSGNFDTIIVDEAHFIKDADRGDGIMSIIASARERGMNIKLLTATQNFDLNDFEHIELKSKFEVPKKIEISMSEARENMMKGMPTLYFVRSIADSYEYAEQLQARGVKAIPINGDMTPSERLQAQIDFERGRATCAVSTNACAQGQNFTVANMIIEYDPFTTSEMLEQKIGRLGRPGTLPGIKEVYYATEMGRCEIRVPKIKTKIRKEEPDHSHIQEMFEQAKNECLFSNIRDFENCEPLDYNNVKYCIPEFVAWGKDYIDTHKDSKWIDDMRACEVIRKTLGVINDEQKKLKTIIIKDIIEREQKKQKDIFRTDKRPEETRTSQNGRMTSANAAPNESKNSNDEEKRSALDMIKAAKSIEDIFSAARNSFENGEGSGKGTPQRNNTPGSNVNPKLDGPG